MSHFSGQCWSMEKISASDIFTPKERDREITEDTWLCQAHSSVEIRGARNWELSSSGGSRDSTNWFSSLEESLLVLALRDLMFFSQ